MEKRCSNGENPFVQLPIFQFSLSLDPIRVFSPQKPLLNLHVWQGLWLQRFHFHDLTQTTQFGESSKNKICLENGDFLVPKRILQFGKLLCQITLWSLIGTFRVLKIKLNMDSTAWPGTKRKISANAKALDTSKFTRLLFTTSLNFRKVWTHHEGYYTTTTRNTFHDHYSIENDLWKGYPVDSKTPWSQVTFGAVAAVVAVAAAGATAGCRVGSSPTLPTKTEGLEVSDVSPLPPPTIPVDSSTRRFLSKRLPTLQTGSPSHLSFQVAR